jgi:predicted transcriptional regulator of viral defense system
MNFIHFKGIFEKAGIFSVNNIKTVFPDFYNQYLTNWQKKGYIIKLRNGWYCFTEFLNRPYALWQTANLLYSPSYISMESALFFYELLPEGVFSTTSVSTNKTNEFDTNTGRFYYYTIKRNLFFGYTYYKPSDSSSAAIMIAEPEKAILDFFYLKRGYNSYAQIKELRFNGIVLIKDIDKKKLYKYLKKYNNKALVQRINLLYKIYA